MDIPTQKMVDGNIIPLNQEEIDQITKEWQQADALSQSTQWIINRVNAYGSINSQLDMLFHQGYDGWKTFIQSVKDTYPKS
jgi:hypothetical protein